MNIDQIISALNLIPLPQEGGFYRETYRSIAKIGERNCSTAIYYLITSKDFSVLHRLPQDEIFHFYLGDPVELIQIDLKGNLTKDILGSKILENQKLQLIVPGNHWQGLQLMGEGKWVLLGTTVSPGFDFRDFVLGDRKDLLEKYPQYRSDILRFTR